MELSPDKIYEDFLKNNLDIHAATKLLLSLIENSDNDTIRVNSIEELGHIGSKDRQTFRILENLLISDSNEKIRNSAANTLGNNFLDRILEPMKWALSHEESPSCLNSIYFTLIKIINKYVADPNSLAKSLLLKEVKKIVRKEFKIGFEIMCETKDVDTFTRKELSEILINYFTIILLEKSYWRLKYKIENCKITELDFIFKGITSLPEPIKYLTHLNKLILRYNQLIQLPDWLGSLNALEELNINVNNLNELPDSIGMLTSLKELYLWKNELNFLPNTIGQLSSLKTLNLRLNQLKELPESIENLSSLKELDLHDNQLKSIPVSLKNLKSLEKLHLSWNNIEKLPESIGDLTLLKILDLERNELIELPNSVGQLSSLEFLNLSDNMLKRIPDSIGNLLNLKYLNLSRNEIKFLPKSIKSLKSLEELYVGENDLKMDSKILKDLENNGVKIYYF